MGEYVELVKMAVKPQYRRRRLGILLMSGCFRFAQDMGCHTIFVVVPETYLPDEPAIKFFPACGFTAAKGMVRDCFNFDGRSIDGMKFIQQIEWSRISTGESSDGGLNAPELLARLTGAKFTSETVTNVLEFMRQKAELTGAVSSALTFDFQKQEDVVTHADMIPVLTITLRPATVSDAGPAEQLRSTELPVAQPPSPEAASAPGPGPAGPLAPLISAILNQSRTSAHGSDECNAPDPSPSPISERSTGCATVPAPASTSLIALSSSTFAAAPARCQSRSSTRGTRTDPTRSQYRWDSGPWGLFWWLIGRRSI